MACQSVNKPVLLMAILILAVSGLLPHLTPRLEAAVFYVDVNGDDENAGSSEAPWATVKYAASMVEAGDTVLINSGTYPVTSQISITTSGKEGRRITFKGNGTGAFLDCTSCSAKNSFEIYFASHITIENLTVRASDHGSSRGIRLTHADSVILKNNTVYGAGHANLFCSLSDHVAFENNEAYDGQIGIYVADSSDYPIVRGNRLHDNSAIGLHMNGDINSGGDGTISYATVERNRVYDNGATGMNCDGVTYSVFRNNLIYNNTYRGIAFFQQDGAVPSNDNEVYLNTILVPSGGYYAVGLNYGANRNRFYNNIIFTEGTVPCFSSTSTTGQLSIDSDYNLFPVQATVGETSSASYTFDGWQALGYDAHSLTGSITQVFENASKNDYQLKAGSPAIDAGNSTYSSPVDIDGNKRPSGVAPDMGAYEFRSATVVYVSPDGSCANHSPCFETIQAGIDSGYETFTIRAEAGTYAETLLLDESKTIDIQGGWDSTFMTQESVSTVQALEISNGIIDGVNLVIQ